MKEGPLGDALANPRSRRTIERVMPMSKTIDAILASVASEAIASGHAIRKVESREPTAEERRDLTLTRKPKPSKRTAITKATIADKVQAVPLGEQFASVVASRQKIARRVAKMIAAGASVSDPKLAKLVSLLGRQELTAQDISYRMVLADQNRKPTKEREVLLSAVVKRRSRPSRKVTGESVMPKQWGVR